MHVRWPSLTARSLSANMPSVSQGIAIEWSAKAIRDMRRLATRDRERVISKVEQYAQDPASLDAQVIMLTGGKYMRLRVGVLRVIFSIEADETHVMVVLRVRHRREAYDQR